MPIQSQWLMFDLSTVTKEPNSPGVYELGDSFGNVVYIGGALSLRRTLLEHLDEPVNSYIRANAKSYRTEYDVDPDVRLKQLYLEHLTLNGEPPLCNERSFNNAW